MRNLLYRAASVLLAAILLAAPSHAAPDISAQNAILIDADSGAVLFARNPDARSLIASTTKIMTAVVVLEHCDLEEEFTIPAEATGVEGSSMYLQTGEVLTIRDLLYGLMLQSGNDAAIALALACSDSVPEFVDLMNLKAQKLGLRRTHFENPNGLDGETHYSTAADLAALTRYALRNDAFREIVSTKSVRVGGRSLANHNKLLWTVEGVIGVKTGYTRAAGRILVSAAERNGRRLIAVTINDGNDWNDHARLYDFGFSLYSERTAIPVGQPVARIPLMNGGEATLLAGEEVRAYLSEDETARVVPLYPRAAFSAGERGSAAGFGAVYVGERQIGVIALCWGDTEEGYEGTLTEDPFVARSSFAPRRGTAALTGTRAREWGGRVFGGAGGPGTRRNSFRRAPSAAESRSRLPDAL